MNKLLYFVLGATAGSVATFFIVNRKYQKMYNEDIKSVQEERAKREEMKEDENYISEEVKEELKKEHPSARKKFNKEMSVTQYNKIMKDLKYSTEENDEEDSNDIQMESVEPIDEDAEGPVVISSREFGEDPDWPIYSIFYCADGVLVDDMDDPLEDVENTVGLDAINHFNEDPEDPDTVYVKNERRHCYYEILLSLKTSAEMRE